MCMKIRGMCYRTRLNTVQGSVYRRWQSLLVGSHTRFYVIWCLDLLSLSVCMCVCVYTQTNILLKYCLVVCLLKFLFSPWRSIFFFWTAAYQEVFIWPQDLGQQDSRLRITSLQMVIGLCGSTCGSQKVRFSIYLPKSSISLLGLIFGSRCMSFSWGLDC